MEAYDELWGFAEDHYGIITSAEARNLGVSRQSLFAMQRSGYLTRLCHGVYQVKHHVVGANDVFAIGVAMAGDGAYLRGASVVAMLNLVPTDPRWIFIGSARRVRKHLPPGFIIKDRTPCRTVEFEGFEGIRCQPLANALDAARDEGIIEADRIADAAIAANEKGLLTDDESAKFQD